MDPIRSYLKDIKTIPLLTAKQEIELATKIRKGDLVAKRQMTLSNLRLVINIAKRYTHLGVWGLGWEVWMDSLEVTQFTYFQQVGGLDLDHISCEITYGLERISMFAQGTADVYQLKWGPKTTYGDLHLANEREGSSYNFDHADVALHQQLFASYEKDAHRLLDAGLLMPAYEQLLNCSHTFNVLDARGAVSQSDRPRLVLRIRSLAKRSAELYLERQRAGATEEAAA